MAAQIAALQAGKEGAEEKEKKAAKDKKEPPYMIGSVYKGGLDRWSETIMMMKAPEDLESTYTSSVWTREGDPPSGDRTPPYMVGNIVCILPLTSCILPLTCSGIVLSLGLPRLSSQAILR
jgi:hypothetical protein